MDSAAVLVRDMERGSRKAAQRVVAALKTLPEEQARLAAERLIGRLAHASEFGKGDPEFDPNQARGPDGKWVDGGGVAGGGTLGATVSSAIGNKDAGAAAQAAIDDYEKWVKRRANAIHAVVAIGMGLLLGTIIGYAILNFMFPRPVIRLPGTWANAAMRGVLRV